MHRFSQQMLIQAGECAFDNCFHFILAGSILFVHVSCIQISFSLYSCALNILVSGTS